MLPSGLLLHEGEAPAERRFASLEPEREGTEPEPHVEVRAALKALAEAEKEVKEAEQTLFGLLAEAGYAAN